jgi:penicillin-binding protein 1A
MLTTEQMPLSEAICASRATECQEWGAAWGPEITLATKHEVAVVFGTEQTQRTPKATVECHELRRVRSTRSTPCGRQSETERIVMRNRRSTTEQHRADGGPGAGGGSAAPAAPPGDPRDRTRALLAMGRSARLLAARVSARRRRVALVAGFVFLMVVAVTPGEWLVYHLYFDRSGLPALEPFIRFEPPTIGVVHDAQGAVLIELAREYRRIVRYDDVPPVLRDAVIAVEDKRFFSHAGVDYLALPRVVEKMMARSIGEWWKGGREPRLLLPQGGSTLTQQLVRGYFLQGMTSRANGDAMFHAGLALPRLFSWALGAPAINKLLRKMEEVRLTLWLEREMRRRYGSQQEAKREIFARYASFIYLGHGRYGFAAASEYYFGKSLKSYTVDDAGRAALLAAISKSPREYEPVAGNRRAIQRRNQTLAMMLRHGDIPESLAKRCQGEPIRVVPVSPVETEAPAVIKHVFEELTLSGGSRFGIEDLFQGRIDVQTTVDVRVQTIVNEALEAGLVQYEKRHPAARGLIQGAVVVLGNADAAILAESGGRRTVADRAARYSDFNRATGSLRQPGSAMKPLVYLAAFETGLGLDSTVPDEPIDVPSGGGIKPIANYDNTFKGPIPIRQALAESRNAVAVWIMREVGIGNVIRTAHRMGIRSPLNPYLSTALGASEVRLVELADAYRGIAAGVLAEPHVIDRVTSISGDRLYEGPRGAKTIDSAALRSIQEGLRGVVRLPDGTAHSLDTAGFPAVMGKTGTTSDFRDALFVGSTYGPQGITVAVRIGFDDNRPLGDRETGGRTAMPIFREIMLRVYKDSLAGQAPSFPRQIEAGIDQYLAMLAAPDDVQGAPRISPTAGPTLRVQPALR